eukprot:1830978-Alexandrium_andersonii.AAC.1
MGPRDGKPSADSIPSFAACFANGPLAATSCAIRYLVGSPAVWPDPLASSSIIHGCAIGERQPRNGPRQFCQNHLTSQWRRRRPRRAR